MKKLFTSILLLTLLFSYSSYGVPVPLTGPYLIPGPKFASLKMAIDTLNFNGISSSVTFNIDPTYKAETAPSGGYLVGSDTLNLKLSATKTFTLNGRGLVLTANTGSGNHDAIFTIQGSDFVTIDSLNLQESSSNTTATNMMEHGYSIVKFKSNDGCKSVSIQKCKVTLNNTNTTAATGVSHLGSAGVFIGNCTYSSTTALTPPTIFDGSHEGLFIFQDSIQNVNHGVYGNGTGVVIDGVAFNDLNLTIQNNTIGNFTHNGIYLVFFNNDNVIGNKINNMASGGTAPTANAIIGIVYNGATVATNNGWNCMANNVELTSGGTFSATGIMSLIRGSGTTLIQNDTVKVSTTGSPTTLTGSLVGIFGRNADGTQNISKNVVKDFVTTSTTACNIGGIWVGQTASPTGYPATSSITDNIVENFLLSGAGSVFGIIDQNVVSTNGAIDTGNIVSGISIANSATVLKGFQYRNTFTTVSTPVAVKASYNTFKNFSTAGLATPIIIVDATANANVSLNLTKNRFQNITAGTGALTGVLVEYNKSMDMTSDTMINFKGGADVIGHKVGFVGVAVPTVILSKNLIDSFSTSGTSSIVAGISTTTGTSNFLTSCSINNSVIKRIIGTGSSTLAYGISNAGGTTTYNINTNFLSDISSANNTTSYSSAFGMNLASTGTNNVYYNTINMVSGATGGTGYGATGMLYSPAGTNKIQNNILRVNVLAGTANNVSAMRASSGAASAAPPLAGFTASSNIYYSPTGANNYLYVEGTTNATLVNGFAQSGLTQNTTKKIVNDTFFNSECGRSTYHKFMQTGAATREVNTFTENNLTGTGGIFVPTGLSFAEGRATDGPVSLDFSDLPRPFGGSDIGALEFNGTTYPILTITITSSTGFDTACTFNLPTLTASIPAYFNRVSYQWYRDTTKIIGAKSKIFAVTPVSGNYIIKVYDSVTGCEYASAAYRMTIVPPPPAIITYYDSLVFCETSAIVLQANKGTGYLYRWMRNGVILPAETDDHLVVEKSGDYSLEVNTVLGCATISTITRVKVYPLPTPVIYYVMPRVLGVTQKYFTYQWYKNNVAIPAPDGIGFRYFTLTDGAYTVEVTDSNGCSAKSEIFLYSLGIDETATSATIKIYPNPATDKLVIESPISVTATLSDLAGRTLVAQQNAKVLEVGHLADGMYLLTLTDNEGKMIKVEKINIKK